MRKASNADRPNAALLVILLELVKREVVLEEIKDVVPDDGGLEKDELDGDGMVAVIKSEV